MWRYAVAVYWKLQILLRSIKEEQNSSHCGSAETNPTIIHEDAGSIPGPLCGLRIQHCHKLQHRSAVVRIWHYCFCGIGWWLQLWFNPSLGTCMCHTCSSSRKKKKGIIEKIYCLKVRSCYITQGTISSHLWWNMMEDNVRKKVYIYMCVWLGHLAVQ